MKGPRFRLLRLITVMVSGAMIGPMVGSLGPQSIIRFPGSSLSVSAATLTVTTTSDFGAGSLRQAVIDAAPGDVIGFNLSPGATITLNAGAISINKNLRINGPGAGLMTLNGNHQSNVFQIGAAARVTISGLTITDGSAFGGGGILISGSFLSMTDVIISHNFATFGGGGIWNDFGTLSLFACTVSGNST